jgi:hypothetical protein
MSWAGKSALLLVAFTLPVWGQLGSANRNVLLRRDPSTSSPIMAHLPKASRLDLVSNHTTNGFYHVRTEDDEVGWIWSQYVDVSPRPPMPAVLVVTIPPPSAGCDDTLWNHVYHPQRLIVKSQCTSVTGTIVDATAGQQPDGVRHEADGDTHGWLKVDPQFQNLLNAGNISSEGGNLVFEIVCKYPVTQPDAKTACLGYHDQVKLPPVGSHVSILGTYVQDTFHAQWMEIHPLTSITVIP